MKKGTLYIVATPIGNLEDITFRAIRVLKEVGLIAAEDTRRTRKLLSAYGISTHATSLHDHNEREKSGLIISKLEEGVDVAYVSDAGTPGISDPGYLLVKESLARSIQVSAVPGPSAVIAALSISGLPLDRFCFHAFLPQRQGPRRKLLYTLKGESRTMVFYESPRRLLAALRDMRSILGNRNISLSRELTKIHEETLRGPLSVIIDLLEERTVKGEITLVVAGAGADDASEPSPEALWANFQEIQNNAHLSTRDAVDLIATQKGLSRKSVYDTILTFLKK